MDFSSFTTLALDGITAEPKTGCRIVLFDEIDSTNNYAKKLLAENIADQDELADVFGQPVVIVANSQTSGRGRLGREFSSPADSGIYLSIVLNTKLESASLPLLTMATSVATRRAIESVCNISPSIKWVNDLYLKDKKICGILLETANSFYASNNFAFVVIGIGINCFPGSFPEELREIAGSISDAPNSFSRSELAAKVIDEVVSEVYNLDPASMLNEYREHCFILGRNVTVTDFANENGSPRSFLARAVDISDNGALIVEPMDGSQRISLFSGGVSVNLD